MQLVSKNNSTYHEADRGATWYSIYPSLAQIEMTMRTSVLLQHFAHHVCIPIAAILQKKKLPPLLPALKNCRQGRKDRKTDKHKKTNKQYTRQDIRLDIRVMVSLSTSGVKLLTLLGNQLCHPSLLLPLIRSSRDLLASSCLLGSSYFFFVVYPDVWSKKTTLLPRACVPDIQRNIHTGLREKLFSLR